VNEWRELYEMEHYARSAQTNGDWQIWWLMLVLFQETAGRRRCAIEQPVASASVSGISMIILQWPDGRLKNVCRLMEENAARLQSTNPRRSQTHLRMAAPAETRRSVHIELSGS
jgi:hypothetical protein